VDAPTTVTIDDINDDGGLDTQGVKLCISFAPLVGCVLLFHLLVEGGGNGVEMIAAVYCHSEGKLGGTLPLPLRIIRSKLRTRESSNWLKSQSSPPCAATASAGAPAI